MTRSQKLAGVDLSTRMNYVHVGRFIQESMVRYKVCGHALRGKFFIKSLHMAPLTFGNVKKGGIPIWPIMSGWCICSSRLFWSTIRMRWWILPKSWVRRMRRIWCTMYLSCRGTSDSPRLRRNPERIDWLIDFNLFFGWVWTVGRLFLTIFIVLIRTVLFLFFSESFFLFFRVF